MQSARSLLLEDQRASGLSVREYERLLGVFIGAPGASRPTGRVSDIRQHETHISDAAETIGTKGHCPGCNRQRRHRREGRSSIGLPPVSDQSLQEAAIEWQPSE